MAVKRNSFAGKESVHHPRVMIKFCGNCNPHIDTEAIANKLNDLLVGAGFKAVYHDDRQDYQAIIILSGCPVDCAQRPKRETKTIVVAGAQVNLRGCEPHLMPEEILKLLTQQEEM